MIKLKDTLFFAFVLFSCNDFRDYDSVNSHKKPPNNKIKTEKAILVTRDSSKLYLGSTKIKETDLIGEWRDSLNWLYFDSCWYGVKYISRREIYTFYPSNKYTWQLFYKDTLNKKEQGEYFIKSVSDSNFLGLASSIYGDTSISIGDTVSVRTFLIFSSSSNKISLHYDTREENKGYTYRIIEFIKK